jgi:hypothetical protein
MFFRVYVFSTVPIDFMLLSNASYLLYCSRSLKASERFIFDRYFSALAIKTTTQKLRF